MKAVILAAGDNTRFRKENDAYNKLLFPVLGVYLIERTIRSSKMAGVTDFVVVTGYQDVKVKNFLGNGEKFDVRMTYTYNKRWQGENGISVYTTKDLIDDNFILLMGDHIFDPKTLAHLRKVKLNSDEVILATDRKREAFPHIEEATKVKVENRKIVAIDKELEDYNALDTGMFLCSPSLFSVLEKTIPDKKFYLTDAMKILAKEGRLRSYDIKDGWWADIDTKEDLQFAQNVLLRSLTKPDDGVISRNVNRKVSTLISRFLLKTPLAPNHLSIITLLLATLTAFILSMGTSLGFLLGGILIQFVSIIDGCDGEVARLKFLESRFGAWFDGVLDKYVDTFIISGLILGYLRNSNDGVFIAVALFAFLGIMLDSYVSNKFEALFRKRLRWSGIFGLYFKRDVRLLILALGAISNQVLLSFVILAIFTHVSTTFRLIEGKRLLKI